MANDKFFLQGIGTKSDDLTWIRDMAATNPNWLRQQPEFVCTRIAHGLDHQETYEQAVDTILDLLALALKHPDYQPCFAQVATVVQQHPTVLTLPFQPEFRAVIADFCRNLPVYSRLASAPLGDVYDLLQAYIKLIKMLSFGRSIAMLSDLIDQALMVSQRLDDHMENARLHQALAHYYIMYSEMAAAEQHGKRAFSDYEYVQDAVGTADAACTLAIIYRVSHRTPRIAYYLDRALDQIRDKQPDKRFATLYYEKGALCYLLKSYDEALSYYTKALAIFEAHGAAYQCAMTTHALALAHTYLRQFDQAAALLQAARRGWEELENTYEQINVTFAEGDLELQRGDFQRGLELLRQALEAAYTSLDDSPTRDMLIDLIQKRINDPTGAVS